MARIGVLAMQGDFKEHLDVLHSLDANAIEVRSREDFAKCDALIIPGGESTVISKLISDLGIDTEIKKRAKRGMPLYGTCAGAIVCAKKITGEKRFRPLGLIDIEVARNAYGRQQDSFEAGLEIKGVGKIKAAFIRAPVFSKTGKKVEVLASFGGKPVLVRQKNVIAGAFHPEIEGEHAIHKLFLRMLCRIDY